MIDMRKKSGPFITLRDIFCIENLMNIKMFFCFVKFWSRPLISLNCSQGREFGEAAFYSG